MRFFSSFAVLTLAAVCALVATPAAAIVMPDTNAARMARGLPLKSPIFKKRGSHALDAPPAKRSSAPSCIAISGECFGPHDLSCCGEFVACVAVGAGSIGASVYLCL